MSPDGRFAVNHNNITTFDLRATALAVITLATACAVPLNAWSAPFQSGNFVAYRTGAETGSKSVWLDEYRADGSLVQSVALSSSDVAKSLAASSTGSEGLLNRSADGKCLTVPGYAAAPGATALSGSTTTVAQRAVAFVGANGVAPTSLSLMGTKAFNSDSIRSAISNDCSNVWVSGAGDKTGRGVWFTTKAGAAPVILNATNSQGITINNGQLFVSFAGGGTLNQLGNNLPTSGTPTQTVVAELPVANFRGIAFVKLNAQSTVADTLYVAANDANAIQKYIWNGSKWTASGSVAMTKAHGLVVTATGDGNALLLVTNDSGQIFQLFDTSGAQGVLSSTATATPIATPAAGEKFYGLALTPEAATPVSAPAAPTQVKLGNHSGNSATIQWTAPASGAAVAFYVAEVSRDNFATIDQSTASTGTSATLSGLQSGAQKVRVRAVNSVGGSASAASASFVVGDPPVTSLPDVIALSSVLGDTNDVLITQGLQFTVGDVNASAAGVIVTATSSAQTVVADNAIQVSNDNGNVTVKLAPGGTGYADVSFTITGASGASITRVLRYAVSANTAATAGTRWYAGRSDASSALVLPGSSNLWVADDEAPAKDKSGNALPGGNAIFAFSPLKGGLPVANIAVDSALGLSNPDNCTSGAFTGLAACSVDGEVDLESSILVGNRMYFAGSHSNNKNGRSRPDRWRLFAVDVNAADPASSGFAGYYQWLREDLRTWDAGNAHGLGANYLGLVSSSDGGDKNPLKAPETDTLSGFSIEGSSTNPDDSQIWLGFRAPLVSAPGQPAVTADSAANRTHALIIPVGDYANILGKTGGTKGSAKIGAPIRLDLGQRGIREIRKNGANEYLIIAGPPNSATGTAPQDFRLFSWDGSVSSTGLALNVRALDANVASFTQPNTACSAEGIGALPASLSSGGQATIISDCGDADFYGDKNAAKDLPFAAWKKFRSDEVSIAPLPSVTLQNKANGATSADFSAQSAQGGSLFVVALLAGSTKPSWEQLKAGVDANGQPASWTSASTTLAANTPVTVQATGLAANTSYVAFAVIVAQNGTAGLVTPVEFRTGTTPPANAGIQFPEQTDRTLGSPAFNVTATGGAAGKPIQFSSLTDSVCKISAAQVTLLGVGTCTLRASQADAADVVPVDRSFKVSLPALSGNALPGSSGSSANVSGNGWQFAANSAGPVDGASLPPLPTGYRFVLPTGFGFVLAGGSNGAANVTLQWSQAAPGNTLLWKFGPTKSNPTPHWYDAGGQLNSTRTGGSFSVTDGGDGDDDLLANGVIIDPVFVVAPTDTTPVPTNATRVPTLSEIGKALLALALAASAALGMRRRGIKR